MKNLKYNILIAVAATMGFASCTDLDEKAYDRIGADVYYQNENSVKAAVASIYGQVQSSLPEAFYMLQEFSADQVTWRCWMGGTYGYDEGEKYVLSTHTWSPQSVIINNAWKGAWTAIGLSNQTIEDLEGIDAATIKISEAQKANYIAEARMLRAWNYYSLFEIWGGALPLCTTVSSDVPGSAGANAIYNFISTELDECLAALPKEDGSRKTVNRMNQGVNRILKARLLLNSEVFIGEDHYAECEALCKDIYNGVYGAYSIANDYRDIYSINNVNCPEVVFAFACEDGQGATNATTNVRNMTFLPYMEQIEQYFLQKYDGIGGWDCTCLTPSYDNGTHANIQTNAIKADASKSNSSYVYTTDAECYLDKGDKLGAVYARFDDRDIRKQNYTYDLATGKWKGMFLSGPIYANFGQDKSTPLKYYHDRDGQDMVFVDQLGTFQDQGRELERYMSSRWGEINSGIRLVKYPMYPAGAGEGFKDIDEVEFRLAEVVYMIAECEIRKGNFDEGKKWVDLVRKRYFTSSAPLAEPGPGFTAFDKDWMLSQWGLEYLNEGRRRRTDLRRFDKFTQGQWFFFGRTSDDNVELPAKRDRKYEWYPLPSDALLVNPGLVQNPGY